MGDKIRDIASGWNAKDGERALTSQRLVAILAGDIADLSRLMDLSAESTVARVKRAQRDLIAPSIIEYDGRLLKATGDGFIAIFDSPLEAVRCGIVIQQSMARGNLSLPVEQRIEYRIGITLDDVTIEAGDVFGENVNVEYCLENIAEPGEVYISGDIYRQVKRKLACRYELLGGRTATSVPDPSRVYRVLLDPAAAGNKQRPRQSAGFLLLSFALLVLSGGALWYTAHQQHGKPRPPDHTASAQTQPAASRPGLANRPQPSPAPSASAPSGSTPSAPSPPARHPAQASPAQAPPAQAPPAPAPPAQARPAAAATPATRPAAVPSAPAAPAASAGRAIPAAPAPAPPPPIREPAMKLLRGGSFAMGSNEDPTEKPVHRVAIKAFAIGQYPVSVREWNQCAAAKACAFAAKGNDGAPIGNVSFSDAIQFVQWLAAVTHKPYRLPTEAEWEYAARGGTQTKFWWGNKVVPGLADCKGCTETAAAQPAMVGSFKPNPFGLYDMGGAIDQWVEDCWHGNYRGAPVDGSAWTESGCMSHVIRSGSWQNDAWYARPSARDAYDTNVRYPTHGFRVALSLH